jgi:tRNA (mo5U34)-methyltransferase
MRLMPNEQELLDQVNQYNWYHHMPLGPGVVTAGSATDMWEKDQLPSFQGKTVLDIGAWDGAYSFLAEREGASRAVALDHYVWGVDWDARERYWNECAERGVLPDHGRDATDFWDDSLPGRRPFDFARSVLDSRVEAIVADFTTVDLDSLGQFDVVLYLGVLYHMPEPLTCLKRVRQVTRGVAAISTVGLNVSGMNDQRLLQFQPGNELGADFGNWFVPSVSALESLCLAAGFARVEVIAGPPASAPVPAAGARPHRVLSRSNFRRLLSPWSGSVPAPGIPSVELFRAMVHAYVDE